MKLYALALATLLPCLVPCFGAGSDSNMGKTAGNPSAPILLEVYSDFMCPHCKVMHETILPSIMQDYVKSGKAYLIFREFPPEERGTSMGFFGLPASTDDTRVEPGSQEY